MTIAELLTGSVVFSLSAGASLQLWALASAATVRQEQLQLRLDQADAVLVAAEVALRRLAAAAPVGGAEACGVIADRLQQELEAVPAAPGLVRQLQRPGDGDRVLLSLAVDGTAEPRQRMFLPAALGLCGGSVAEEVSDGQP
jgi:hypothetical protein